MFWLWLSLAILLVLFILIIFTKLTILVNYYHHNDNDDLKVEFRVWFGLIRYKLNVPLIKIDDNSPSIVVKSHTHMGDSAPESPDHTVNQITNKDVMSSFQKMKELLQKVFHLHVIVRKFFKRVTIKKLEWHTLMGVGDAAHTGMVTGAIWGIKGSIIGLVSHYFRMKEMPHVQVTPHFQAAVIQTHLTCMIQFRIGYAILAGLKLIKFRQGGKSRGKSRNFKDEKTKSV